jgi:hopanoid biosynthesis associated RND transporter like protein HpnN
VIVRHPWAVLAASALLAAVAGLWSWGRVHLDANTDSLMGNDRPYVAEYKRFLQEFGDLEYAWVVVDADGTDGDRRLGEAQRAADLLAAKLREEPSIERVNARVGFAEQMRLATWNMPTSDLSGLVEARDALPSIAADAGTGVLLADAQRRLDRLGLEALFMPREEAERVGAAAVLELEAIAAAAPEAPEFIGRPREDEYLASDSGRLLFVGVMPRKDFGSLGVIDEPLRAIRKAIDEVRAEVPGVQIGLTGKPVLQSDEMATTDADMNVSTAVGIACCMLLIMAVFRGVRLPLLTLAAFGVACLLTYAAAALLYGRLNLLSIVFMLVLVGVGMDYGVFMISRYLEARRHLPVDGAVRHMMRTAVPGNVVGAGTAAGVFFIAWFTEFQGLRELGVVAGTGLLLSLFAMVIVLPALIVAMDGRLPRDGRGDRPLPDQRPVPEREHGGHAVTRRAAWATVSGALALTALATWYGLSNIRFESNLLKLQAKGLESVEWEHRVMDDSAAASWFGAVVVDRMDQIPPLLAKLREHPEIGTVTTVLDAMALDTPERAALRAQFANAVETAPFKPRRTPEWGPEDLREAGNDVAGLAKYAEKEAPEAAQHLRDVGARLLVLADLVDPRLHGPDVAARMRAHVEACVTRAGHGLRLMAEGARLPMRDALPVAARDQMMSPSGKFLLMIHPAQDVWEPEPLERFVGAMRAVDPHATGVPMTVSESMKSMARSFAMQSVLATLLVTVILWVDLRNVREVFAALLSLAIGVAWSVALMALFGASFNLANFFAVPILIGLGIDSVIHMTNRAHEGGLDHGFGITRPAVIVTALTTILAFGALVFAHHQGLRSLGIALSVGSVTCLITAVWVLPSILRVVGLKPRHATLRLVRPDEAQPERPADQSAA